MELVVHKRKCKKMMRSAIMRIHYIKNTKKAHRKLVHYIKKTYTRTLQNTKYTDEKKNPCDRHHSPKINQSINQSDSHVLHALAISAIP